MHQSGQFLLHGAKKLRWVFGKPFGRLAAIALALVAALASGPITAQDTVTVRNADGGLVQRTGLVVDVNAERVVLKVGEREQKIPFSQVVQMRTSLDELAATGDLLLAERKYELAFAAYGKGLEATTPAWMRRRLLAGRVKSAVQMKAWSQAADEFLALVASDPYTQYFSAIPLAWTSSPVDVAIAKKIPTWLGSSNIIEQLIAASHGLADANRDAALKVLANLSKSEEPRIAALAQAQRWRASVKVDSATLAEWTAHVDAMPEDLRAGPHFVLGNALGQVDQEAAVLHLMRVPVLFADRFDLAARALLQAAEHLLKLNRAAEARIVLQEIVDKHSATADADLAAEKLSRLSNTSDNQRP